MPDRNRANIDLLQKLNLALERCGYPLLEGSADYRQVGSGAWHDAYWVKPSGCEPRVIRLRKQVIYGQTETWDAQALHEDYAPVGLYYQEANQAWPGTCPNTYDYSIDPDLIFTIESYLPGEPVPLGGLSEQAAFEIGESVGAFFQQIHAFPAPLPGTGLLTWDGEKVTAESPETPDSVWQSQRIAAQDQLDMLKTADLVFDQDHVQCQLEEVIRERAQSNHSAVLVNQDISPENLLVAAEKWVGLVDPVPALGDANYFAAWFTHCYRLFLPALAEAPRYMRHQFSVHQAILGAIADGYEAGYTEGDPEVKRQLRMSEFLWALDLAYESFTLLQSDLSAEMRLRRGDETSVAATLQWSLRVLEGIRW